jgi:hypothetical protein
MRLQWKRSGGSELESAQSTVAGEYPPRRPARTKVLACSLFAIAMSSGCTIGPKMYESSFNDYNDVIRKTSDSQMLSNLVRMRYLESPVFLQVSSVSTSFTLGANAGLSATNVSGGNNQTGATVGGSYSENPTITFSLPESRKYYGMLMAPLSSNQVLQLIDGGWNSGAVLRTGLRAINGLKNVSIEYSTYPSAPESYGDFIEAISLLETLNRQGLADLAPGGGFALWSSPIGPVGRDPLAQAVLAAATVYAKQAGGDLVENADGKYDLHIFSRRINLRFAPASADSPDAQRLKNLLQLKPDRNAFPMFDYEFTALEKGIGYFGESPAALDPEAIWEEIGVRGRSMMEIMQIASTNVQVPQEDIDKGNVFVNPASSEPVEDARFVVKSSEDEPTNATVRTRYRGHWFYIEDNDLQSRQAFALLTALFAVTAGTVPGANPVLTIPVN